MGKKVALRESDPNQVETWSSKSTEGIAFKHASMRAFVDFLNSTNTTVFHVELPFVDMTGLEGAYDFGLTYSMQEFIADRDGTLLFSALRKIGLEPVRRKAPVKTLIIDHAERPPEN